MVDVVGLRYVEVGRQQVEAGAKSYQRTVDQTVRSIQVAASATQQQGRSLDRLTRDVQKAEREMQRLAQAQARGSITGAQFTGEVNRLSARLRSAGLENAQSQVMRYARASSEAARATSFHTQALVTQNVALQQNAAATQFAGRRMSNTGVIIQQSGYQIGDFLVQVQSGTNAFVAFGQQATQVVGTLTLLGGKWVLLGTVLGIAIPLLTAVGAYLMRTSEAAREAAGGIDVLADHVQRARREIADMAFEIEAMQRGFEDLEEFALVRAIEDAQARMQELSRQIYELEQLGTVTGPNERALEAQRELLATLQEQLETYVRQREEHERLSAIEEAREALAEGLLATTTQLTEAYAFLAQRAQEIGDAFKQDAVDAAAALEQKISEAAEEAAQTAQQSREVKEQLAEAKRQAELLAAVDMKSNIAAAADEAARVARNLAAAQARIISMRQQGSGRGGDPRVPAGPDPARFDWTASGALESADALLGLAGDGGGGGGGGGGGAAAFISRVEGLRQIQDAIAAAAEETRLYEQEVRLLDSALNNGVITQQRYNELLVQAQEAYGQALQGAYDYTAALESVNTRAMRSMEDAIMSVVDGSQTAAEAFRSMAQQILNEAFRLLVVRPLMQSLFGGAKGGGGGGLIGGLIGGAFPNANGNAFAGGNVVPFARGGVVDGPMTFPMSGGRTGLMGEAGSEAIMPLKRTKGGKLGVAAEGGGFNVTVTMDPSTGAFGAFVRNEAGKIVAQAAPQIIEASRGAVVDTVQRGGSVARTFR